MSTKYEAKLSTGILLYSSLGTALITQYHFYTFIHSFIHSLMALQPFVGPWSPFQFRNLTYTDGRTPCTSDQPFARPLPAHRTTQTQKKTYTQTSMPRVGFEPTIPVLEWAKTVHALDSAATVIGLLLYTYIYFFTVSWSSDLIIQAL
jgi:hypothetical protein